MSSEIRHQFYSYADDMQLYIAVSLDDTGLVRYPFKLYFRYKVMDGIKFPTAQPGQKQIFSSSSQRE